MTENEQLAIRGFQMPVAGTYVLLEDVVGAIRSYAQSLDDANDGALIHELGSWLSQSLPPAVDEPIESVELESVEVYGAEDIDESRDLDRIEIYPDPPDDPRPKWYARMIDTGGFIMRTTNGSFDQEWVIQNAQERWPGKSIHLLKNAGEDSKWTEDATRGVFPSKGPPIRRLWANQT